MRTDTQAESGNLLIHLNLAREDMGKVCNQNCLFCLEGSKRTNLGSPYLPTLEELVRTIDESRKHRPVGGVTIAGGEPTLSPLLENLIAHITEAGLYSAITTNGVRLAEPGYLEALASLGLRQINFSIHGLADTHNAITRNRNSFSHAFRGLKNAMRMGMRVTVNYVLTSTNLGDAIGLIEKIENECGNVSSYRFFNIVMKLKDLIDRSIIPDYESMKQTCSEIKRFCDARSINCEFKNIPYCFYYRAGHTEEKNVSMVNAETRGNKYYFKSENCRECKFDSRCNGLLRRNYAPEVAYGLFEPIR